MIEFNLKFDSQDRLYLINLSGDKTQTAQKFLEKIKASALEKNLIDLLSLPFSFQLESLEEYSLLHKFKIALHRYRGDLTFFETKNNLAKDLICRCNGLFKNELIEIYQELKGNEKEFYKKSKASMICSQCRDQIQELIHEQEQTFYQGERLSFYAKKIEEQLGEYFMFAPFSSEQIELSLEKITAGKARVRVLRSDSSVKKEQLYKSLIGFLPKDITQVFEISLVISDK